MAAQPPCPRGKIRSNATGKIKSIIYFVQNQQVTQFQNQHQSLS